MMCKNESNKNCKYVWYSDNTGGNDKIVVLKKTTQQLYLKTFIENRFR